MSCDETEMDEIKSDIYKLKEVIKLIKKHAMGLPDYLRTFYSYYDKDNSDEIELNEFVVMIKDLNMQPPLITRLGIMLFRIFDRRNLGYFSYEEFSDIVDKKMRPNYKRLVRKERIRWARDGPDLKWPPRKQKERTKVYINEEPKIITKEKIVQKIKEVPVEKEVIVEKIIKKPKPVVAPKPQPKPVPPPVVEKPKPKPEPVVEPPPPVVEPEKPETPPKPKEVVDWDTDVKFDKS
jgi:hypothetical protein